MNRCLVWLGLLASAGCSTAQPEPVEDSAPLEAAHTVGTEPDVCDGQCSPILIDHDKSLVVTDPPILARFPLRRVLDQLITMSGASNTPDDVWKQWWLSQGQRQVWYPPHWPACDDPNPFPSQVRDFGFECPRAEEQLSHHPLDTHVPIALFNRFDLAPLDGANCGEYRIVYAADPGSGVPGQNLIIFEGVLPNPNPDCGLAGCVPVAEFWQSLTTEPDVNLRADHLDRFYFDGICGFPPVVRPEHYGMRCDGGGGGGYGGGCGQIRTNQFLQPPWTLREFRLAMECPNGSCELMVKQQPVAQNPHPDLWDSGDSDHGALHGSLLGAQLARNLPMPDGINLIAAETDPRLNASESIAEPFPGMNRYDADPVFENAINLAIAALPGSPVGTAIDIEERVTAQSCGGCHELSNFSPLGETSGGPSLIWPPSLGFKHVDIGGALSPALQLEFLPWREQVLHNFLAASCGHACFNQQVNQMLIKDVVAPVPDQPEREVRFNVVTWDEWVRWAGDAPVADTLSGSRTH